mmetsp:Transcript_6268/g.14789  ORF Transcript_6268/g.14789 Transcript_6268/m.14789 type:complete len:235 (+) Transcript_6268:1752-2456(+)
MERAMCRCSSLKSFSLTDIVNNSFEATAFSSDGKEPSSTSSKIPCIILFKSEMNFETFFKSVRVSSVFSSCSSSFSPSSASLAVLPSISVASFFSFPFSSGFSSGSTAFSSCSFSSSSAFFLFHLPRPRPFPFFLPEVPKMSSDRSSNFWIMIDGVTKSGITFCQNNGSSTSRSAVLLSAVNLDLLTTIPCLFSQDAVLVPSTTRVRVRLARMLSISSVQKSLVISSFSSSKRA